MPSPLLHLVLLLALVYTTSGARKPSGECVQTRDGCRIAGGKCECGHGCYTEFRYNGPSECQKALRSTRRDICRSAPCRHGTVCSQITIEPGYKCRCEGSGFYGQRCDIPCPKRTAHMTSEYPFECIVV